MVLGGRHLFGIFVLLVVLFGVIFTLGYLLGRSQYDTQLQAAASTLPGRPETNLAKQPAGVHSSAEASSAEPPSDWDFYHSGEPAKPAETLPGPPKPVSTPVKPPAGPAAKGEVAVKSKPAVRSAPIPAAPVPPAKSKSLTSPLVPRGASVLQVAALGRETDALALAQALQKKKFPAFVLNPPPGGTDHFYRVQVGPYGDATLANAARQKLQTQGFKSIIKR